MILRKLHNKYCELCTDLPDVFFSSAEEQAEILAHHTVKAQGVEALGAWNDCEKVVRLHNGMQVRSKHNATYAEHCAKLRSHQLAKALCKISWHSFWCT